MRLTTNLLLIFTILVVPAYAGDRHKPEPTPINVDE